MASQGPRYPTAITTEIGPSGDNDWVNASNIGADDGTEADITHSTYDAGDHSYRLKAQGFGFTIPAGATIDGIVVEIDRRDFAGDAQDQEVRLYDASGTLVGDDKQTATSWPATLAVATYGSSSDDWSAGLTAADINDADFGVALIVLANSANTDIGVDFIRVTVHYTAPPVSVTPGTASLVLTGFAPTVRTPRLVTPGSASLALTAFEPTVSATSGLFVRPGVASLTLTAFAPTVINPRSATPGLATLVLTGFAPSVLTPRLVTPGKATLVLTAFEPVVTVGSAGSSVLATPGTAELVLTGFAPTVLAPRLVRPGKASLVLTAFVPDVSVQILNPVVTPGRGVVYLTAYPPTVFISILNVAGDVLKLAGPRPRYWWYQGLRRRS